MGPEYAGPGADPDGLADPGGAVNGAGPPG